MNSAHIFQTKKIFSIFAIVAFLASSLFLCHTSLVKAAPSLEHNFVHEDQISHEGLHHSSDSCHFEKETLANQNNPSILSADNQIKIQSQQKLVSHSDAKVLQSSLGLDKLRGTSFVFSESSLGSQTAQLLTVVKIE